MKIDFSIKFLVVAIVFFFGCVGFALITHAATYTADCTVNNYTASGASCSSADFQLQVGANPSLFYTTQTANDPGNSFAWTNGHTYYVVTTSTGTVGGYYIDISGGADDVTSTISNTVTNAQHTITLSAGGNKAVEVWGGTSGAFGLSDTDALVSYLCISDTSFAECTGGGGGGSTTPSVATSTDQAVANNIMLQFFAFLVFMFGFALTMSIWIIFKR